MVIEKQEAFVAKMFKESLTNGRTNDTWVDERMVERATDQTATKCLSVGMCSGEKF